MSIEEMRECAEALHEMGKITDGTYQELMMFLVEDEDEMVINQCAISLYAILAEVNAEEMN